MSENRNPQNFIWYFAYGSNMNSKALKIRRVNPIAKEPAKLYGWKLTFNVKGFPFFEPAFANMEASEDSIVHGVCLKITQNEWEGIKVTEGNGIKEKLKPIDIEVECYDGKRINAKTLISLNTSKDTSYPSKQYLNLIIDGAVENQLDPAYIHWVKSHKSYVFKEHVRSIILYPVCLWLLLSLIPFVVGKLFIGSIMTNIQFGKKYHALLMRPLFFLNFIIYIFAWRFHDLLYSIFGPLGLMNVQTIASEIK